MTSRVSDQTRCAGLPAALKALKSGLQIALFGAAITGGFVPSTHAQNPPLTEAELGVGGTLRNEVERSLTTPILPKIEPKSGPDGSAEKKAKGETMVVSKFRFVGNTLLSDSALNRAVAPYIGRPVDFEDLQNAAALAALAYRDRGFLATVSIPRQEIDEGVITLRVAEARYGGAKLDPTSDGRINSELILDRIERAMKLEKAVNTNVLDRTVLLLNDLPGASVQAGLAEGQSEGETQVVLQSRHKPVLTGSLGIDQHGSVSTGEQRELMELALNSPTGRGEQLTLSLMHSEGTRFGRAGFSMPIGLDGVRAGFNASRIDYRVIGGPQALSNLTGQSSSASADVSYPVVRSQQGNLYVSGSYTAKWFENFANQIVSRSYGTQVGAVSMLGNWLDNWLISGANNQVSASASLGRLEFNDEQSRLTDIASTRMEGMYRKLNVSVSRSQSMLDGWMFYTSASAQEASRNLDSSEKFFVGGASGVRAYPTSEGGGSSGQLLQVALRKRFSNGIELRMFRDEGRVQQTIDPYPGNPTPDILRYSGGGLAMIANLPRNLTVSMVWSRRIGDNSNPLLNSSGDRVDQDGTKHLDRFWLAASITF